MTFGTELARAGVHLLTAQNLTRIEHPKLTANDCSDLCSSDLHAAVASLPSVVAKVVATDRVPFHSTSTDVHSLQLIARARQRHKGLWRMKKPSFLGVFCTC
jgi:hypothetical protein